MSRFLRPVGVLTDFELKALIQVLQSSPLILAVAGNMARLKEALAEQVARTRLALWF